MTRSSGKNSSTSVRLRAARSVLSALALLSCSGPAADEKFVITAPPGSPDFDMVSEALEIHCGTLNCHGNVARNMRLFGFYGARCGPKEETAPPGAVGCPYPGQNDTGFASTTRFEREANYESVISIEPERLSQIVRSGGANPDKWIVLSKGRADEHHKGGTRLVRGDAADTCIVSWIASRPGGSPVNAAACQAAATVVPPGDDWSQ